MNQLSSLNLGRSTLPSHSRFVWRARANWPHRWRLPHLARSGSAALHGSGILALRDTPRSELYAGESLTVRARRTLDPSRLGLELMLELFVIPLVLGHVGQQLI